MQLYIRTGFSNTVATYIVHTSDYAHLGTHKVDWNHKYIE